jgi:hypothetical protein
VRITVFGKKCKINFENIGGLTTCDVFARQVLDNLRTEDVSPNRLGSFLGGQPGDIEFFPDEPLLCLLLLDAL